MRTMGLYVPPDVNRAPLLQAIGVHRPLALGQAASGGMVIIDVEATALKAQGRPANPHLADKALTSVIVHEHAHAAAGEGQPFVGTYPVNGWPELPNETLAEWAELEFFRGDPEMFQIVMAHAAWGKSPHWPYAGAVPFARRQVEDKRIPYRKLLRLLRADANAAVSKVLSMQRP